MDPAVFEDVANSFAKLRMYPYFDICHYILMSIAVKEDTPQSGMFISILQATSIFLLAGYNAHVFWRGADGHNCMVSSITYNVFLLRYMINYFPFDLLYRMSKFLPIRLLICSLKEIQRARKISMGVHHGLHQFPESAVMCVLLGLLKGCGSVNIRPVSQFVMGTWEPKKNPVLVIPICIVLLGVVHIKTSCTIVSYTG
ncbi:unnamed protein product [Echinostoma caproni]|uniref:Very-long-chain 3-oxoacyl-CoA synthase n=1 Tax=Echinostoma caproni TaxID=27848 RepID=A0A183BFL4_9TREM|nr:unnamed protein product [Echinostoma caproni]